jgi:uncharacterized membrane protein
MSSDREPLPHYPNRERRRVTLTASPASSRVHNSVQIKSVANINGNYSYKTGKKINILVNLFSEQVLRFDTMSQPKEYTISDTTELEIGEGAFTAQEKEALQSVGLLSVKSHSSNGDVNRAYIDIEALARMAFEYDLLRNVASRVEIDILETFRRSDENTLTTSEIAKITERPKSSVSRALSQLVEKNKLTKVQAGVYRHPQ